MTDINDSFKFLDRMFIWLGGTVLLCLAAVGAASVYSDRQPSIDPCHEDEARIEWVMPDGKHTECVAYDDINWTRK